MDMDELDYVADILKEKCNSFKIVDGRLVKYQITFKQWKASKVTRQILHDVVKHHKAMKK